MSKYTVLRWTTIDKCLRNNDHIPRVDNPDKQLPGYWTLEELAEEVGKVFADQDIDIDIPSVSTIKKDLSAIKKSDNYDVEIVSKYGVGYTYKDKSKSISKNPLNDYHVSQLKDVISILNQFRGFKHFEDIGGVIQSIQEKTLKEEVNIVSLDTRPNLMGTEFIDIIIRAIKNKYSLEIVYASFKNNISTVYNISPYQLKQYNNRWFVLSKNNKLEYDFTIYSIDRIKDVKRSPNMYIVQDNDSINKYFDNIYGTSIENEKIVENIIIKVKRQRSNYLVSKPDHPTQVILTNNQEDDFITFGYKLVINKELISYFLSYGSDLEVIAPNILKQRVSEIVVKMYSYYKSEN